MSRSFANKSSASHSHVLHTGGRPITQHCFTVAGVQQLCRSSWGLRASLRCNSALQLFRVCTRRPRGSHHAALLAPCCAECFPPGGFSKCKLKIILTFVSVRRWHGNKPDVAASEVIPLSSSGGHKLKKKTLFLLIFFCKTSVWKNRNVHTVRPDDGGKTLLALSRRTFSRCGGFHSVCLHDAPIFNLKVCMVFTQRCVTTAAVVMFSSARLCSVKWSQFGRKRWMKPFTTCFPSGCVE